MQKHIKEKFAVFIDAANILYSQKDLGWRIDYQKLKSFFEEFGKCSGFYYYTGKVGNLEKQKRFLKKLKKLGYNVYAKEVKLIRLKNNQFISKGNLDIELALDAFRLRKTYNTLILMSGDSDFAYLLELIKKDNKNAIVISTRGHISRELIVRAKYIDLPKFKNFIEYKKITPP